MSDGAVSDIVTGRSEAGDRRVPGASAASIAPRPGRLTHDDLVTEWGHGVTAMRVRRNRDVLITANRCDCVYVNHDGWLLRYKILHDGSRQIVDFILPGQIFGVQACLFKNSLYSVAAITDASLSVVSFDMIDRVFERSPRLAKALFWSAVCEAAICAEHLIDAARRSAYQRISHLLLELFVRLKAARLTDGMSFTMPLTQELIGDALGLTTVHVNRTVRSLREDKLIAIEGKTVTIIDFEALSRLCDFENSYLSESALALENELGSSAGPDRAARHMRAAAADGRSENGKAG